MPAPRIIRRVGKLPDVPPPVILDPCNAYWRRCIREGLYLGPKDTPVIPRLWCVCGFNFSMQANLGMNCNPKKTIDIDSDELYTHFEVLFRSWDEPRMVGVKWLNGKINESGGIDFERSASKFQGIVNNVQTIP